MISRRAENTVGRRLRSSSATTPPGSGMTTVLARGAGESAVADDVPTRRMAASITGSSTRPRSFSAVAVICRPRATSSTHGST